MQIGLDADVPELISDYTIEGRKAVAVLADAIGLALYQAGGKTKKPKVTKEHVMEVVRSARMSPQVHVKAEDRAEVGENPGPWGKQLRGERH